MESFKKFVEEDIIEVEPLDSIEYNMVFRATEPEDYDSNKSWGREITPLTTTKNGTSNLSVPFLIPKRYSIEEFTKILERSIKAICITQHNVVNILDKASIHNPNLKIKGTVGNPVPYHNDQILYRVLTPQEEIKRLSNKLSYIRNVFQYNIASFSLIPSPFNSADQEVKDTFLDLYTEL